MDDSRDLSRAKCRMKKCCLTRGNITCVDCAEYESRETVQAFLNHPGHKYSKYNWNWSLSAPMIMLPS